MVEEARERCALPILEVIAGYERDDDAPDIVDFDELAEHTGLTDREVDNEIKRLVAAGCVNGEIEATGGEGDGFITLPRLAERGARAVGQWPSNDPYDALLALLDQWIFDQATDPETKSKLERLRTTLVDVGKGAAGGVLAALVRYGLGLP